jgi:hypothetical protein
VQVGVGAQARSMEQEPIRSNNGNDASNASIRPTTPTACPQPPHPKHFAGGVMTTTLPDTPPDEANA